MFITPIAFKNIGYRTWIIFACTNLAIIPLVYFFYPETAFRSLEEVDVIFYLADEAPGNPWLNAVKISLHEPLWFGKRGENTGFEYANSSWHRRLMDSSGSGSGTGSDEKRRHGKGSGTGSGSSGQRNLGSSGSDTVAVHQPMTEKRSSSESPVDPMMYKDHNTLDHSPTNTLTTTITSHKNDSKRSLRQVLTRSRSSEQRASQAARDFAAADEQQRIRSMQAMSPSLPTDSPDGGIGRFSPDADPSWWTSDMAPQPLRVSRPPSEEHRPYSSESTRHRSFHHPDHVEANTHGRHGSNASVGSNKSYVSFSYPGRLRSDGIRRTESDGETYWPDGIPDESERRPGVGSRRSSAGQARDAGRAF